MLEILMKILKIIFNKNLFCVLRVIRGFSVAYGKKSLGEIFNKIWPMARNNLPLSLPTIILK